MSQEVIERFAQAVRGDKGLQEEFKKAATSNEAILEFAKSHGCNVTLSELMAYIERRKAVLNLEELEQVAGGKGHTHHSTQAEVSVVGVAFEAEAATTTTTAVSQAECVIIAT